MSRSSTARNELGLSQPSHDTPQALEREGIEAISSSNIVDFPDFSRYGGIANYAITARLAGRMNAASVSPAEHRDLLREREQLLKKKYGNGLSPRETRRLDYIRWSLDRIEDARHGQALDELESRVELYERFEVDLRRLIADLGRVGK